jgi:two-component system cell cycle response regulator
MSSGQSVIRGMQKAGSILADLRNKNSILVTVLNSIFDGIYVVDMDRRIIFWNRGAEEITGYSAEEVMGRRCSDNILNHIDGKGILLCRSACPLVETLRTGRDIRAKVFPLRKKGGRFPVETHIGPIRNEQGEIVAAIEVFRDISGQEEFRMLQEKFNELAKKYMSTATLKGIMDQLNGSTGKASVRELTVLYLDVVNFTGFSERHSPEETAKMLNDLFNICDVITKECHGDIDKFIGDAVMAVFIDVNDAVLAGMKVLKALSAFNAGRVAAGEEEIQIRIGVNSGSVIQGEIGTPDRKTVTVIGDVVNIASRIESISEAMCMCISEATYSRLKDPKEFRHHKAIEVKNRKEPVSIYRYVLNNDCSEELFPNCCD